MNKMSLCFIGLAIFYVFPLMSIATGDAEIESMKAIQKQLLKNWEQGGSTVNDIEDLQRQFRHAQEENEKLKTENNLLKRKISEIKLKRTSPKNKKFKPSIKQALEPSFNYSPVDEKGLIYMMYIAGEGNKSIIDLQDRIDFSQLDVGIVNQNNLFDAFLEIEQHLLKLIKKKPHIVHHTIYVGLTKGTLKSRFNSHLYENNDPIKKVSTNKNICIERVLEQMFNVKVSYLIKNANNYLNELEVLVANILLAQEHGASARIGKHDAWETYLKYKKWSKRIEVLTQAELIDVVHNIAQDLFYRKIGKTSLHEPKAAIVPTQPLVLAN